MPVIRKNLRLKNKQTVYGATEKILLSTTPKIAPDNIEAMQSTQNSLPPGTTNLTYYTQQ